MPINKYFQGSGDKVMRTMQARYGAKQGKSAFYATANKRKMTPPEKVAKLRSVKGGVAPMPRNPGLGGSGARSGVGLSKGLNQRIASS